MILILTPNIDTEGDAYKRLMAHLSRLQNIRVRVHREQGAEQCLTEVYLIGNTASLSINEVKALPGVERAGKYGIRVVAMEVTHESHIEEIREALELTGSPTGVMLQIGTRNTQNFELLKIVGRQREFPVLLKRGFGITLDESLNAAEYLASEGNHRVIFGLRGMKTNLGDPHRNFVDFAQVPVVKRLTRMPV